MIARRRLAPVLNGLYFTLVSALLAAQPLAATTYLRLFYPEGNQLIQTPPGEGLPVPRALVWSPGTFNLIGNLGRITSAGVLGLQIALSCLLVYGVVRILNPTFRMTTGVDWDHTVLTRTYMHTAPLIKAFLIAVAAFIPAFTFWEIVGYLLAGGFWSILLRSCVLGAVALVLFSREGVAGDFESGNYEMPRDRAVLRSLLLRGALAGVAAAVCISVAALADSDRWLVFYRSMSMIGEGNWWRIAALTLGFAGLIGLAGGTAVCALGSPRFTSAERLRIGVFPFLLLVALVLAKGVWVPGLLANRYDYTPNSRQTPEQRLSRLAGVRIRADGLQTAIVLFRRRAIVMKIPLQTVTGLSGDADSARRVERFMDRRRYATALSDPALKTMHDSASLSWDPLASLRVDYLALTRCPEMLYLPLFLSKIELSTSAPEVKRYADALADERQFDYPDRDSLVRVGDVYARLGVRDKAESWYRRAQLPESQVGARLAERTMFADGRIAGRLLMNGRPAAGERIALVPAGAIGDFNNTAIQPGVVRPFWLRWLAAVTTAGSDGHFDFQHIVAGEYRLVLLTTRDVAPPLTNLPIHQTPTGRLPWQIFVGFAQPAIDLGTIDITMSNVQ